MNDDDLLDYIKRLNRAAGALNTLANDTQDPYERQRIKAKAEGVMLAFLYLSDYPSAVHEHKFTERLFAGYTMLGCACGVRRAVEEIS